MLFSLSFSFLTFPCPSFRRHLSRRLATPASLLLTTSTATIHDDRLIPTFCKKLVSRCVYLNILKATEEAALDQ